MVNRGAPVDRKADWFAGQLSTSFPMLRANFRNRLIAGKPALAFNRHVSPGLAHEILPVAGCFHGLGKPQELLGVDETLGERDLFRAGDL
jgi:hypothetical protein